MLPGWDEAKSRSSWIIVPCLPPEACHSHGKPTLSWKCFGSFFLKKLKKKMLLNVEPTVKILKLFRRILQVKLEIDNSPS
jgi:hypothetical protein